MTDQPTHTDLQRDFGRMEGRMDSLQHEVGEVKVAMANGFKDVKALLEKVETRLDSIDAINSERRGAWKVIVAVSGAVSLIISIIAPMIIDWFTGR